MDSQNRRFNSTEPVQDQQRYYPKNKAGNYDEWAAVIANQYEAAQQAQRDVAEKKKAHIVNEYGKHLYIEQQDRHNQAKRQAKSLTVEDRRVEDQKF